MRVGNKRKWPVVASMMVVVLALVSVACERTSAPYLEETARPILSDEDIDRAPLALARVFLEVVGSESGEATVPWPETDLLETPDVEAREDLAMHAVLPDAEGVVAFIRNNPNLASNPWTVFLSDQVTGDTTLIYGGRREVQSVAVSGDGDVLALAMRRTIDANADVEVYLVTVSTSAVVRLTATDYPESNVSMSSDGRVLVWEGEDQTGKRAIYVREEDTLAHLAVPLVQREPTVSANGQFIGLIRILNTGNPRVVRYDRFANTYLVTWGQESPITLSDPSVSDDGTKVAFVEYRPPGTAPTERQLLRYIDLASGSSQNAAGAQLTDGPRIAHPHLTGDGNHMAYAWRQGEVWNIFTLRVDTSERARVVASPAPVNNYAPYWQVDVVVAPTAIVPTSSDCDASVPLDGTCALAIDLVGPVTSSWRGAEFEVHSLGLSLVQGSVALSPALADAGCLAANGPVTVAIACSGAFVGNTPLVQLEFTRSVEGPASFDVTNAALVNQDLELVEVMGGSLEVEGP